MHSPSFLDHALMHSPLTFVGAASQETELAREVQSRQRACEVVFAALCTVCQSDHSVETQQGRAKRRVVTWNVNGSRILLEHIVLSLGVLFERLGADIVCFQEIKLSAQDWKIIEKLALAEGWTSYFSLKDSGQPYHGVATFCKDATAAPVAVEDGLAGTRLQAAASAGQGICLDPYSLWWWRYSQAELEAMDNEGRCIITDHHAFVLFNLYLPACIGQASMDNENFRCKLRMLQVLDHRINALLHAGRAVLVVGDFNIEAYPRVYRGIDLSNATAAFLSGRPDREWLSSIVGPTGSLADLYRCHGCRVDFILAGGSLTPDPGMRLGHAPACGSPAAGAAAGAAPEPQCDVPLLAQAPQQVPLVALCDGCDVWADFIGTPHTGVHAPVVADFALASLVPAGRPPPALPLSSRVRWNL